MRSCPSRGGPYARFRRALDSGNLLLIRSAAAELPAVPLEDALAVCLVLRGAEPESYNRAVMRWLGRFCLERPGATVSDVRKSAAAFERLPNDPARASDELRRLCR